MSNGNIVEIKRRWINRPAEMPEGKLRRYGRFQDAAAMRKIQKERGGPH